MHTLTHIGIFPHPLTPKNTQSLYQSAQAGLWPSNKNLQTPKPHSRRGFTHTHTPLLTRFHTLPHLNSHRHTVPISVSMGWVMLQQQSAPNLSTAWPQGLVLSPFTLCLHHGWGKALLLPIFPPAWPLAQVHSSFGHNRGKGDRGPCTGAWSSA